MVWVQKKCVFTHHEHPINVDLHRLDFLKQIYKNKRKTFLPFARIYKNITKQKSCQPHINQEKSKF